jgi:hypothetical protein|uniref:RING-type domain-containing protein n=1 Tax=viral metagenome TaxID=1070528 RepID=A0A6C0AHF9_9ZZZZ
MDTLIRHMKTKLETQDVLYLPIHTIDSVNCSVSISVHTFHEKVYRLHINTKKDCIVQFDDRCSNYHYYSACVDMDNLKSILDTLKYNALEGKFQLQPDPDWRLLESESVKLRYEKCCLCLENIDIKTNCEHALCIPCYDKIPLVKKQNYTACPICRKKCFY